MKMFSFLILGIVMTLISNVHSDSVCDLNTFIVEVKQDLADNGILDCQRVIDPPHFVEETEDQKNLRIAAQWDTSCAFEANNNWIDKLKRNYEIIHLVDSIGEPVKKDFDDQADLCEILRAAVWKNLFDFPDWNMQKIPPEIVDKIDCAGIGDNKRAGPRICAATGSSFFQNDSWTIFLDTSSLRAGGKPDFEMMEDQPETIMSPYTNEANPELQNKLIRDLMKFSPEQLDMKQGELIDMIDRAQYKDRPKDVNYEKDNERGKSKDANIHSKRLLDVTMLPNQKFMQVEGGETQVSVSESKIVFGYYMATLDFEKLGDGYFKLNFANREMSETRQIVSQVKQATLTSAFAEVYNPKEGEETVPLKIIYDVTQETKVTTDAGDKNFSFGAVAIPEGEVYKKINSQKMEFFGSDKWNVIPNFELNINFQEKRTAYFFIMYNLAFKVPGKGTLKTRLKFNKSHIPESSSISGPAELVGVHSGIVLKVKPGNTPVNVEYKYDGPQVMLLDHSDSHFVQSITAFELPMSTIVKNWKLTKPATLNSKNEWKGFDLEANIALEKKKTVMIIYHVNLKVDKFKFATRVRMGSKYNKKSVFTSEGQGYTSAQGYIVRVLKAGRYTFDIDYKSLAPTIFDPTTSEMDGQLVDLQVIIMD